MTLAIIQKRRSTGRAEYAEESTLKIILHLCADIGSDSYFFAEDPEFEVIKIGAVIWRFAKLNIRGLLWN